MAGTTGPFDLGKMAFGGLGQMFDGIDSVKRAWSMFNAPSALVPTLDVDELDKRIADLKAVEQWLNLNVSMLHGTIQGLEIQRGTLAAVKAFGASFSSAMPGASAQPVAGASAAAAPSGWPHPAPASAASAAQTASTASTHAPASAAQTERPRARSAAASADTASQKRASSAKPAAAAPGIDPGAWWNLLQGTFNQVAQAALTGTGLPGLAQTAAPVKPRRAAAAGQSASRAGAKSTSGSRANSSSTTRSRKRS
jgi:hypothetical protein